MLVSEVLMSLSLVALGYYFYKKDVSEDPIEGGLLYLPIVATLSFIASFMIGIGKVHPDIENFVKGSETSIELLRNPPLNFSFEK